MARSKFGLKNPKRQEEIKSHLREGSVVPDISMVRETIANKSELAAFDVLLDGVERFLF